MHPKKFGDSYDIVKRFLLSTLAPLDSTHWKVHPMLTRKTPDDFADHFKKLLGNVSLVSTKVIPSGRDRDLVSQCHDCGHLFLDPDTGLELNPGTLASRKATHIYLDELCDLAKARPTAITVVFDQSIYRRGERIEGTGQFRPAPSKEDQIQKKLQRLFEQHLEAFAYKSHACFLFVGKNHDLVRRAYSLLEEAGLPRGDSNQPGLVSLMS